MLGAFLRRNMSQKLSLLLLLFGLAWGVLLLHYTARRPRPLTSAQLRGQILELSQRYVKVLTEESQSATGGLQGTSMAGYADLKRTIAVLLDDILSRLVKLEGRLEVAANGSAANVSHGNGAGGQRKALRPKARDERPEIPRLPLRPPRVGE